MKKSKTSIINHVPRFFEYLDLEKGVSKKTQETYGRFLKSFVEWIKENNLEEMKPHELTDEHIWNYRVYLSKKTTYRKEPIKKNTRNYYLIAVRAFLNYFTDRNIDAISSEKIKLAKFKNERMVKFLDIKQIEKLLLAPNTLTEVGLRDRAILETFFSTGLRVAELVSLNRDQVRIEPETETLEISIIGKGNNPRSVYFSPRAVRALRKYLCKREDKEKALFIRYKGPKKSSMRLTTRSIESIVKKYAKKVGVPIMTTPHTLRHSYATDLLSKGVDLRVIQEFLGHRNIATTQVYTHLTSQKLKDIHKEFHSGDDIKE
jgi:site-specific recombinase XerD